MKIEIEITKQDIKDLKTVRNYFGEHDRTIFEHKAYAVLDSLVKKLNIPVVIVPKGTLCDLDGKTVMVKFKVTKRIPRIVIEDM